MEGRTVLPLIKQHLRLKAFYGTTLNAVRIQVWVAISVYLLVAIAKKQLRLDLSLYKILQVLSITIFEKSPILEVLAEAALEPVEDHSAIQLQLFPL